MNPQDSQQPNTSTKEWFDNISSPPGAPITNAAQESSQPSPKHSGIKKPIIIGLILLLTISALGGGSLALWLLSTKACLSAADYQSLTGTATSDQISSQQGFYTASFSNGSASQKEINKIAAFYKAQSDQKSILITLSSSYTDSEATAQDAVNNIKKELIRAGVNSTSIALDKPTKVTSENLYAEDIESAQDIINTTYLTITSSNACR